MSLEGDESLSCSVSDGFFSRSEMNAALRFYLENHYGCPEASVGGSRYVDVTFLDYSNQEITYRYAGTLEGDLAFEQAASADRLMDGSKTIVPRSNTDIWLLAEHALEMVMG